MYGYLARKAVARRTVDPGESSLEDVGVKEMRVLVTGHRGYIGSPLVDRLKAAVHDVVGVDTELYEDCTFGGNKDSGIPTINRDIRELSRADLGGLHAIAQHAG